MLIFIVPRERRAFLANELLSLSSSAMASIGLYMIAIAFAYPIQCYPAIQIILEVIKNHNIDDEPSKKTLKIIEIIARPMFVLLSCKLLSTSEDKIISITIGSEIEWP